MEDDPIRALVFDFGGVFTRSEVSTARLLEFDEMLHLPPGTVLAALFSGEAWEMVSTGRITPDIYWARAGQQFEERLPREYKAFRHGIFWSEPLDEEMVALACRLHRRYPLALCSNALPELQQILASRADLANLFDARVISVEVGMRKPEAGIFKLTAARLGLPLRSCLLIDDKVRNTKAAEALGMPAITYRSAVQLERELAERGLVVPA